MSPENLRLRLPCHLMPCISGPGSDTSPRSSSDPVPPYRCLQLPADLPHDTELPLYRTQCPVPDSPRACPPATALHYRMQSRSRSLRTVPDPYPGSEASSAVPVFPDLFRIRRSPIHIHMPALPRIFFSSSFLLPECGVHRTPQNHLSRKLPVSLSQLITQIFSRALG